MKFLAAILMVILVSHCAFAADGTRRVNVFTLTNGSKVVAAKTSTATVDGKTTYQCTQMDGSKTSFYSTQVANLQQQSIPTGTNVGYNRSINLFGTQGFILLPGANYGLGNQIYGPNGFNSNLGGFSGGIDSSGSPVIGYLGNGSNVQYANQNQFQNAGTSSGMVIGMNPNVIPSNWNSTLAQIGSTYIPNNVNQAMNSTYSSTSPSYNNPNPGYNTNPSYSNASTTTGYNPNTQSSSQMNRYPVTAAASTAQSQVTVNHQGGTYNKVITYTPAPAPVVSSPSSATRAPVSSASSMSSSSRRK